MLLLEELLSEGFNVQLQHVEKETSWEDRIEHGYVALIDGETVLAKRDGFQHNGNLVLVGILQSDGEFRPRERGRE